MTNEKEMALEEAPVEETGEQKKKFRYMNVMEEIVEKELDNCIDSLGLCRCPQCRVDVIALSLNRLKSRYVSSEKGRLLSVIDQMSYDYIPEILRAITESAEVVKKNPRHEKKD